MFTRRKLWSRRGLLKGTQPNEFMSQKSLLVDGDDGFIKSDFIDQLTYRYYPLSNRLLNVYDASNIPVTALGDFRYKNTHPGFSSKTGNNNSSTVVDYTYYANGNMVKDFNKDTVQASVTDRIEYNHLNLPSKIYVKNKGTIEYVYVAAGTKLRKVTTDNSATSKTITTTITYIGGREYESKTTVPTNANAPDYTDQLQFNMNLCQ